MKDILIFLHCSGGDKQDYCQILNQISNSINAKIISFNSPLPHPVKKSKYLWFNKDENHPRRDAIVSDFNNATDFIINEISNLNIDFNNIIVLGHSQGGAMAANIATQIPIKLAVSICADMPYNIEYTKKSDSPIVWFEAKNDGYINKERQDSHKLLSDINANLHHYILENSSHMNFQNDTNFIIETIKAVL